MSPQESGGPGCQDSPRCHLLHLAAGQGAFPGTRPSCGCPQEEGLQGHFKDVKKGSILPDLSTLLTWGGRRETHEDCSDRTSREQVGRWAEGRGLVLQSLGSWLGSDQTGRKAGVSPAGTSLG